MKLLHLLLVPALSTASLAQQGLILEPEASGFRARGPGYEAAFVRGGMDFRVGAAGIDLTLESVALGEQTLLRAEGDVAPVGDGLTVEYHHGSIVERYDVLLAGVEQSFVFAELPRGGGDLVVRLSLATDLTPTFADPARGIEFGPSLSIGAVTGIDAAGREEAGWIRFEGGMLELGLPSEFVASAELPLVLDPLLGSTVNMTGSCLSFPVQRVYFDPDLTTYGGSVFYAAFRGEDAAPIPANPPIVQNIKLPAGTEPVVPDCGNFIGGPYEGDYTPAAGFIESMFGPYELAAFDSKSGGQFDSDIVIKITRETASVLDVQSSLTLGSSIFNDIRPSVGWGIGEENVTVVWQQLGLGIRGAVVRLQQNGTSTSVFPVLVDEFDVSDDGSDRTPMIVQSWGSRDVKMVVWERTLPNGNSAVVGRRWSGESPGAGDPEFLIRSTPRPLEGPDCAGVHPDDFYVVWDEEEVGSSNRDVRGRRLIFLDDEAGLPVVGPLQNIEADSNDDEYAPKIAARSGAYLVAYLDGAGAGPFLDAKVLDTMTGNELEAVTVAGPLSEYSGHSVAATHPLLGSDDEEPNNFGVVWGDILTSSASEPPVIYRQLVANPAGNVFPVPDTGCKDGGEARASSPFDGNSGFRLELWDGDPNSLAIVGIGAEPLFLPIGTATLITNWLTTVRILTGTTTPTGYSGISLNLAPGLSGIQLWVQWATITDKPTCTNDEVFVSDGVTFTIP